MSISNGIILEKFKENKTNLKKKSNKPFDITKIDISPCKHLGYLKCHKQTKSALQKLMSNAKKLLDEIKNNPPTQNPPTQNPPTQKQKGGNDSKQEQDTQTEKLRVEKLRADAATAITYITSNFVLGEEEEVYKLRNYLREHKEMEIDELILRLTHHIKNTKP